MVLPLILVIVNLQQQEFAASFISARKFVFFHCFIVFHCFSSGLPQFNAVVFLSELLPLF